MEEAGQQKGGQALAASQLLHSLREETGKAEQGGGSPPHEPACGYDGPTWELTWERRGAARLSATQW